MDSAFGHWLAGFIAGEGCFAIAKHKHSWVITFALVQRDDDPIVQEICDRLGFGAIYHQGAYRTSKPQVSWRIGSHADRTRLIEILDRYPLRGKKAKDYEIWKQASEAYAEGDHQRVARLASDIKNVRRYEG